jgi:hypothetical protein
MWHPKKNWTSPLLHCCWEDSVADELLTTSDEALIGWDDPSASKILGCSSWEDCVGNKLSAGSQKQQPSASSIVCWYQEFKD